MARRLALIAHDNKKVDLVAWATFNRKTLAEFDLMARIAGLRLKHRWADWDRSTLTADSTKHVSIWEKPL